MLYSIRKISNKRAEQISVLFNYADDGNWWLGEIDTGLTQRWNLVGNTRAFGNLVSIHHLIIPGYFLEAGVGSLIMYYSKSGNWHLGWIEGASAIQWNHVASNPFGELKDGMHLNARGDFDGNSRDEILFYNAGDGNWWFGWIEGHGYSSAMKWKLVGNTRGFGNLTDGYHLHISGDFDGDGRNEILMYSSKDGDWYNLKTHKIGNTQGFDNLADYNHEVVPDKFTGAAKLELLASRYSNRKVWHITVEVGQIRIAELRE